jgi:hypothetical protein
MNFNSIKREIFFGNYESFIRNEFFKLKFKEKLNLLFEKNFQMLYLTEVFRSFRMIAKLFKSINQKFINCRIDLI